MNKLMMVAASICLLLTGAMPALAFTADGCGAGSCASCHSLDPKEAGTILGGLVDKVNKVEMAEVPGMWLVEVEKGTNKLPVYIDFSKKYVLSGSVIRLADKGDVTQERFARMNKVDPRRIPLDDALLLGRKDAKIKVVVFTDPECPFCKKLHDELKIVVRRDPAIAFLIKLFPLKMHPNAYDKAKSIVCARSLEFLELSLAGKPLPPAMCTTKVVDQTLALAPELGIQSTPTLVLPNGLVMPGYKTADELIKRIREETGAARG
ncbi:MAG: DsbC family protein [Desulfuromonadales bacterium]|nr:DsbC family protein [Desulfuromonadales bacterium]